MMYTASSFALVVAVGLIGSASSACYEFWPGLCPGDADCQCTTYHACVGEGVNATRKPPVDKSGGCAGSCRKVIHNACPGTDQCLAESGPCGGPPPPPHPGPPPPPAENPIGPDVSSYQGSVDWGRVKSAGAGFGIAKASEGRTFTDPTFSKNWEGMKAAGIKVRGAYHFGHPGESADDQASHFASIVGRPSSGEFLVLDIESATRAMVEAGNWTKKTQNAVSDWCVSFVGQVKTKTGVGYNRMWIYTGEWFWDPQAGGSNALSEYPLWVSGYAASPPMPRGWLSWTMWQYTDKAEWSGISGGTDSSKFHGSQAELELLVA